MKNIKIISFLICGALFVTITGCGKADNNIKKTTLDFKGYPMQASETLSYWVGLNVNVAATSDNLGNTPFGQELQKKTGTKIQFIHPPTGQERDQFNIMLAADDLPDIIEYDWFGFPGGPEKALKEEFIYKLNDIIDANSPNFKKYLNENKEIDKMVKTDSGSYYGYNFIRGDDLLLVYSGPVVRKDWLEELNLSVPETISEWHTMLKAFKDKKGAVAPLSYVNGIFNSGEFVGAYGTTKTFFLQDGKVKFGPTEPSYKEFLKEFAKWYQEGLIDNNIANVDSKSLDANVLNGRTGATIGLAGSGIGKWLNAMKDKDAKFNIVPAPHVVLNKGEKPKFGQRDSQYTTPGTAAISKSCKNVELAARFLDYGYSDEGHKLYNFGIEGVSYNMENGSPKYTDLIMKNPEKLSITVAMCKYIRGNSSGPFVQDKEYVKQYYGFPQQKEALDIWLEDSIKDYMLPRLTPMPEESTEIAKIMNDVNTNVDEMTLRFITGVEPIENFDAYVANLNKFNIGRATELYQLAYERYLSR